MKGQGSGRETQTGFKAKWAPVSTNRASPMQQPMPPGRPRAPLVAVLLALLLASGPSACAAAKRKSGGGRGVKDGALKKETKPLPLHSPEQTQEETMKLETPQDMKCDACVGVSAVYAAALLRNERRPRAGDGSPRSRLTETAYLDVMESTCVQTPWVDTFGVVPGYGGRNYLTGPGLEDPPLDNTSEDFSAVVTRRGGFWEHRFKTQCMERGGLDEDDLYEAHWAGDGGGKAIAAVMCHGKKQACGKYPSPRDLIPKEKWNRGHDELGIPDDPPTGRKTAHKPRAKHSERRQEEL